MKFIYDQFRDVPCAYIDLENTLKILGRKEIDPLHEQLKKNPNKISILKTPRLIIHSN